ncbi:hypothetical protein Ae406Ps2_4094c [Pseudonocardia sp. Ae406_Ps2]|nr:hypothetical protein Ae331Ps2_1865 [Pseudonocardia sp. Ae331_Ps2]OLM04094.1 hypothetical protein Ae406Ps2_4094c [Pseudonocardia sp. Ae406_Ps2]OLM25645.1 hypothetical protein Ae706Ps2_4078c [Pseudonocardia sp. Ae706_Ps2]
MVAWAVPALRCSPVQRTGATTKVADRPRSGQADDR